MHRDTNCVFDLAGFHGRSLDVGGKMLHLWGVVSPDTDVAGSFRNTVPGPQFFRKCPPASAGLWQITTSAVEYRRDTRNQPLDPLPDSAISLLPGGTVAPFTRRTITQLQVSANDGVDQRIFEMDANQSITIVAQDVCVRWMAPEGTVDVLSLPGEQLANLGRVGAVFDAFLGTSISRIESTPGNNSSAALTRYLFVPAGVRASLEIPSYAQDVTIYQDPSFGTSAVMWTMMWGDPNVGSAAIPLAALPFLPGLRRTAPTPLPNASHLWTDIDPDFGRFFTLRWTIRP